MHMLRCLSFGGRCHIKMFSVNQNDTTFQHATQGQPDERDPGMGKVLSIFIPLVALVALPIVAMNTGGESVAEPQHAVVSVPPGITEEEVVTVRDVFAEVPDLNEDDRIVDNSSSQITYVNLDTGEHIGSASERFVRSSLSLSKLYIAHYVFAHGTARERAQAYMMVQSSSNMLADRLYAQYPESIKETAKEFNLQSTVDEPRWGYSQTSAFDVSSFIAQLLTSDPDNAVLRAMRDSYRFAADRTRQNYGTYILDGVEGSKWGWSDDKLLHSAVSFGRNSDNELYVATALITGSAEDLSTYVEKHLGDVVGLDTEKQQ